MLRSLRGGSLDGRGRASGEYTLDGVARLGSIVGVPGRPWTVVVQMPEARAYGENTLSLMHPNAKGRRAYEQWVRSLPAR